MNTELQAAAQEFDLMHVAQLLYDRKGHDGLSSLNDALQVFPELGTGFTSAGYDGRGRMAFNVLAKNEKRRVLVIAAMEDCAAPPHVHVQGEDTIDVVGSLLEHSWTAGHFSTGPAGSRYPMKRWAIPSFHQPFTPDSKLWIGVYDQPGGLLQFDKMNKEQLAALLPQATGISTPAFPWAELSDDEARDAMASALQLMRPPRP